MAGEPAPAPPPLPDALDATVRRALENANRCTVDADCSTIGPACPVACHVAVNVTERARIVALLARSPPRCHMVCTEGIAPRCVNHRCVEGR